MKRYSYQNSYLFLSSIIFLVVWEIIAKVVGNQMIFPDILSVFNSLIEILKSGNFLL